MKLSQAMLLGSTIKNLNPNDWNCCLLGVSVAALGCIGNFCNQEATARWPWINKFLPTPAIYRELRLPKHVREVATATHVISEMAGWVYDGKMTLEQAVDWVRSVEPQEEPEGADIRREQGVSDFALNQHVSGGNWNG